MSEQPAILILRLGSVALLLPTTADAADWLRENCQTEPWQWQSIGGGDALAVEPDAAEEITAAYAGVEC